MPKLKDLLERRTAITAELEKDDVSDSRVMELRAEYDALKPKIARAEMLEEAERREAGTPVHGDAQLTQELRTKFSLGRAVAGMAGLPVDWGFEREMQVELAKRGGRSPEGVLIPAEIFETRVLTTSAASELVSTDHRPDLYVSALVASSVVRSLGATVLNGLTGNVSIPRETDSPAIGWVAENAALSSDDANFDAVTLSPKHAGALTEWSRNMLLQSSPDVEALMRRMLARNLSLAIDTAAIQGGGTNEPTGILATSGIQTQAFDLHLQHTTAPMIVKCDVANVGMERRAFLTSNSVKHAALVAYDSDGNPKGMPACFHNEAVTFSNLVPEDLGTGNDEFGLIYADWSELLLGIWSEIDLLVNPYESTAYSKGNISIRAMATVDVALRHKAAFVSATGVTATSLGLD